MYNWEVFKKERNKVHTIIKNAKCIYYQSSLEITSYIRIFGKKSSQDWYEEEEQ